MVKLIVCLDPKSDERAEVDKIVNSGLFDSIYIIGDNTDIGYYAELTKVKVSSIPVLTSSSVEVLQETIIKSLKSLLGRDKMTDLDIALNISSGSGRLHAAVMSSVMKLGYGIRLIGLDKDGDVAEL